MNSTAIVESSAEGAPQGLAAKARLAVLWNTGFNVFRDLLQFGVMLVLVRLLDPEAYGQFGLVTSIIGFISILSFNSFTAYTLQVRREEELHYQDHFTAGLVIQLSLFAIANIVGICVRWFPAYREVAPLIHVMSLTFLISFPCDFRIRMLERDLDWKRLRILHAVGLLIVSASSIALAALGAGVYALLCPGMLVALPFIYDLIIRMKWRPTWSWSWKRYESAARFGMARIGSGIATTGRQLMESGVMANVLGFATLGFVNRATGLAQIFCIKVAFQLLYAIYPALTRLDPGSDSFRKSCGIILRAVAWATLPVCVVLGWLARPVVLVVYGERWNPVASLLPWAMGFGFASALAHTGYMLLLANNKPRWCLALDCFALLGTLSNLIWALPFGIVPYFAGITCQQLISFVWVSVALIRVRSINAASLATACLPPIICAAVALGVCETAARLSSFNKGEFAVACVYGTLFCTTYAVLLRFCFANQLRALIAYLPGRRWIEKWTRLGNNLKV